jgi:site-specific recombinase XerD
MFLDDCRYRELSEQTLIMYESDLTFLVGCATVMGDDTITGFTTELVQNFFQACQKRGNIVATLRRKRSTITEFAKFCLRKRLISADPTYEIPKFRKPLRLPRPYTTRERERLMELTETVRLRERIIQGKVQMIPERIPLSPQEHVIRALLYYSGVRVGTLVKITLGDITLGDRGQLGQLRVISKGNRELMIPIVPELAMILEDYIIEHTDRHRTSHLLVRKGQPMSKRMIQTMVEGWGLAADVPKASAHRFRHTAGKEFLETGASLEETQGFLGHANIATTQVYRRVTANAVSEAALRRSRMLEPK